MNNGDMPASPISEEETDRVLDEVKIFTGLTKREHIAAMAMQGMLGDVETLKAVRQNGDTLPAASVKMADALLKALETKEEG